jgi:cystathionine gamma-lyase
VCDKTVSSPFIQRPVAFGFDLVVQSATKYLNGRSDVIGGIVVCAHQRQDTAEAMAYLSNVIDPLMSPFGRLFGTQEFKDVTAKHAASLPKCSTRSRISLSAKGG